jgi:hypothetical protein
MRQFWIIVLLTVNLATGQFSWTPGTTDATHGAAASYNVKCGSATGTYTITSNVLAPATSVAVSTVVPLPGTYFCVATAVNSFGESAPSNEVNFQSGYTPSSPAPFIVK